MTFYMRNLTKSKLRSAKVHTFVTQDSKRTKHINIEIFTSCFKEAIMIPARFFCLGYWHPALPEVLRHSVKLQTLPQDTSLRERVEHPALPEVLRHSVKLQTLPQDTSLRERVEHPASGLSEWRSGKIDVRN
jgi:hypothetical protein